MNIFGRRGSVSLLGIKPPAVAGLFYPDDARELRDQVRAFVGAADASGPAPKAIIAPHAGYRYSGPVAGSAYAKLANGADRIRRVVLLGPAHRHPVRALAASSAGVFKTPLGDVEVDVGAVDQALRLPQVERLDAAFAQEHSLEVHLPFLIECLPRFRLVPFLVGNASPDAVGEVLELLWGGAETAIVISSDLSHYHDYDTARHLDAETSQAIVEMRAAGIGADDACGRNAINGLLPLARQRGMRASTVDVRSSGDTAGPAIGWWATAPTSSKSRRKNASPSPSGASSSASPPTPSDTAWIRRSRVGSTRPATRSRFAGSKPAS